MSVREGAVEHLRDRILAIHAHATHDVPFSGSTIPIIAEERLVDCKAIFNRPRDWIHIDSLLPLAPPISTLRSLSGGCRSSATRPSWIACER